MRLTEKELEIMVLFWANRITMTAAEIVEASQNRSWSENSIYILLKSLITKKALVCAGAKPAGTNYAKAYEATVTFEEYITLGITVIEESFGIKLNIDEGLLFKHLGNRKEG